MAAPSKKRQFVWTLIPSGRTATTDGVQMGLFSILLTPRLIGPVNSNLLTLSDYGMEDWPARLADVHIKVFRSAERLIGARRVPLATADKREILFSRDQQSAAWRALFPANTLVRSYQSASYSDRHVQEFPASEAGAIIKPAYSNTVRLLAEFDHDMRGVERGTFDVAKRRLQFHAALEEVTAKWQDGLWSRSSSPSVSPLRRGYDFYRRETHITKLERIEQSAQDFHDIVARVAEHPILLRVLGLLLDFAAPTSDLAGEENTELYCVPSWSLGSSTSAGWDSLSHENLSPRTAYKLSGTRFVPRCPGPAATTPQGLLPLADTGPTGGGANSRFEIMPFDVDGAVLRLVNTAESDRDHPPQSVDPRPTLPALRSVGFALLEKTRAEAHAERLRRARQCSTSKGLLGSALTAENLTAGYRLDVFDADARNGEWRSLCERRVTYIIGNLHIGEEVDSDGVRGILEEGYVRPDSVTTGAGANDDLYLHQTIARWDGWSLVVPRPERVPDLPPTPPNPVNVRVDVGPGSLPRLRFGRKYALRARLADLAGGGIRRSEAGPTEQQSNTFRHLRFEPIPPPEIAPTRVYMDGEGSDQLIIRSDRGVTAADYAAANGYRPVDVRHILPPKSSLELSVQHGRFDAALGGTTPENEVKRHFNTATRADLGLADIPGASLHADDSHSVEYVVLPETPVSLSWLADVASYRVALIVRERPIDPSTGTPGSHSGFEDSRSGMPLAYRWIGRWPDFVPITLRVQAASAGCRATIKEGPSLTWLIELGPAQQVTLDVVSCPDILDINGNGIAAWAGAKTDPVNDITKHIIVGLNPLVSPPRTIKIVHAVQHPLSDPSGRFTVEDRGVGDTHAILSTRDLILDVTSTGKIDIHARWSDIDDTAGTTQSKIDVQAVVGSFNVRHLPLHSGTDGALPPIRQEFTDTRRRKVTYTVTAISRFQDYFPSVLASKPDACSVKAVLQVTDVPSSARPSPPALRHLVPTLGWTREGEGTTVIRSTRHGGGVRAFFERPWFLSGVDEELAVLAWPESSPITSAGLRCVSVAGQDPIWDTGRPSSVLNPSHFSAARRMENLPEANSDVAIVVYPIKFDPEIECWFCDIDMSPLVQSSYFPFVRLAFARFQAGTIRRIPRLSVPIVSEPTQLLPHREMVTKLSAGHALVTVAGLGPGGASSNSVQAELQVFEGPASAAPDALIGPIGWRTIATKTAILGAEINLDIPSVGARQLRISVTESESYTRGVSSAAPSARLVYADIVQISS